MNYPCPDESRLKLLISEAFDDLPSADGVRLGQIGSTLGKQAAALRPGRWPLKKWLFWLLLGAATTATAWWAGERLLRDDIPAVAPALRESVPIADQPPAAVTRDRTEADNLEPQTGADRRSSPIIDRRERY